MDPNNDNIKLRETLNEVFWMEDSDSLLTKL